MSYFFLLFFLLFLVFFLLFFFTLLIDARTSSYSAFGYHFLLERFRCKCANAPNQVKLCCSCFQSFNADELDTSFLIFSLFLPHSAYLFPSELWCRRAHLICPNY